MAQEYLHQHGISQKGDRALETLKYYRDAVAMNTQIFGVKVERLLTGVQIKLEEQRQLSKEHIEALLDEIRHQLRRLELRGELTRERIVAELDRVKHRALEQRWITEAQWKMLVNDLESAFASQAWYRRFLGQPHQHRFNQGDDEEEEDDGFSQWAKRLESKLRRTLSDEKALTRQQIRAVVRTIKHAVRSAADIRKVGDKSWWRHIRAQLERNYQLTREQAENIVQALEDDINAYRVFAMDYVGDTLEQSRNAIVHFVRSLIVGCRDWIAWLYHWYWNQYDYAKEPDSLAVTEASSAYAIASAHSRSVASAVQAASSSAHKATQAVQYSASSIRAHVRDTAHQWQKSFAQYWIEKERQAYKRIGYTEAQLDWLQKYLEHTFQDQKSLAKHNVDRALHTIRRFLQDAKVESATQIEHQITRLQNLLEAWKRTLPTERAEL